MTVSWSVVVLRLAILGLLLAPFTAQAQPAGKLYRIGYLDTTQRPLLWAAFRERFAELGYVEGRRVAFELRWADGKVDRLPELAAELVRLRVDAIVTASTPAAQAAQRATTTIPIVMATGADPVGTGLVPNLARPGGNLTGMTTLSRELSGKRLQLFRDALPKASRMAMLWHQGSATDVLQSQETESAARTLGLSLQLVAVRDPGDLDNALGAVVAARAGAVLVASSPVFFAHRQRLAELALKHRLPTMFAFREYVEAGGLMCYGPKLPELFRRAADYVDRILRGTKPGDLPIEQPTRFELVVNLRTAKALGVTLPQSVLLLADEVIQ